MVGDASGRGGGFFQRAQAGGGLAGIEDAAAGARHGVGELAGQRGDAAQALQEIERHALALEQQAGRAVDFGEDVAVGAAVAIALAAVSTGRS